MSECSGATPVDCYSYAETVAKKQNLSADRSVKVKRHKNSVPRLNADIERFCKSLDWRLKFVLDLETALSKKTVSAESKLTLS